MDTTARSAAASALARARAASLTPERRSEIARQAVIERWRRYRERQQPDPEPTGTDPHKVASLADAARKRGRKLAPPAQPTSAAEAGAKGGHARAARLTATERSEAARKAVEARWNAVRGAREESSRSRWDLSARRHVRAANSYNAGTYRRTPRAA